MPNEVAPEGQMYVCGACGKRSRDKLGEQKLDDGYDESCFMNAVLVYEKQAGGKYIAVPPEVRR